MLTEGIVKDIIAGNKCKIVQNFVQSSLIWGIHEANDSPYKTIEDINGKKAAISRYGSGSHLMAYINAQSHKWDLEKDLNFEVIKNLDGAVEGLTSGKADYFLWENSLQYRWLIMARSDGLEIALLPSHVSLLL